MISRDWQETFKILNLHGALFLKLGLPYDMGGNLATMHEKVYPILAGQATRSATGWDQCKEKEEGKRMRRLIRTIWTGHRADPSNVSSNQSRNESAAKDLEDWEISPEQRARYEKQFQAYKVGPSQLFTLFALAPHPFSHRRMCQMLIPHQGQGPETEMPRHDLDDDAPEQVSPEQIN